MQVSAALRGRRLLARRQPGERRQLLVRRRMRSPRRKQTALGKSQCTYVSIQNCSKFLFQAGLEIDFRFYFKLEI